MTLVDFDGNVQNVRAHSVRGGRMTRSCLTFLIHVLVLVSVAILGATMAIIHGYGNEGFAFWISLFTFAIGNFVPEPKIKKTKPGDALATVGNMAHLAAGQPSP